MALGEPPHTGSRAPLQISARDNPLLAQVRRLLRNGGAYRRLGQVWLEGEHLCAAFATRGKVATQAVIAASAWAVPVQRELAQSAARVVLLSDPLFASLSTLESPAGIGFLIDLPAQDPIQRTTATVVLDRLQDAGNVGSIMRSAAALGASQVLALKGTVALWSPKVLRAGMGAHFGLNLLEGLSEADLLGLRMPLVATSSHAGVLLPQAALPSPCAWVMGHEGQGVSVSLLQRCAVQVRIPQPGGQESLNVAAAAAVCLYESARQAACPSDPSAAAQRSPIQ